MRPVLCLLTCCPLLRAHVVGNVTQCLTRACARSLCPFKGAGSCLMVKLVCCMPFSTARCGRTCVFFVNIPFCCNLPVIRVHRFVQPFLGFEFILELVAGATHCTQLEQNIRSGPKSPNRQQTGYMCLQSPQGSSCACVGGLLGKPFQCAVCTG